MSVELRDLRWAITASQHRSLRQAAETLKVRQSTLSRRLRAMEYSLGAELFERTNGGTSPTIAGLEFLSAARHILAETDAALRKLRTRSRGETGQLTIGVYASLSTGNMHATLVEHHRQFPEVEVQTVDGTHDRLFCGLASNVVDVAIMTDCRSGWGDRVLPLWSEIVIIALADRHPLAANESIHWSELAAERMLAPQYGAGQELERLLTAKLCDRGPRTPRFWPRSAPKPRQRRIWALLMLEGATGAHYDGVTYRQVHDGDGPTRLRFQAYWRQSNSNPTLTPFLAMLRQRYPDLSAAML